ncbi:MAG: penicillin-binding protein [Mogibacterium sp.]|nr:penicillin-binding protein [Mogibacterium sp.]
MRKQERRAWICLMLAMVLVAGIGVFGYRLVKNGGKWASFYGNTQIYTDGYINRGTVKDRNGEELLTATPEGVFYSPDRVTRLATVHAVGDPAGNIPAGAINMFRSQLIGYDLMNGTYDTTANGKSISLTIDANANREAYYALDGRTGAVGVYNWKTGEIVCMVSNPSFDPQDYLYYDEQSDEDEEDEEEESIYFNNFLDATMAPGSTFKLVTSAAVIDTMPDRDQFEFECDGVNQLIDDREDSQLVCVREHGTVDFREALAESCNGAFGALTREVGADTMKKYVKKAGLTEPVDVNGVQTAAGSFDFPDDNDVRLSWAGIGQAGDLVNPCAMMVYMGAIANGGEPVQPSLFKSATFIKEKMGGKSLGRYIDKDTAAELKSMMKNNVVESYGEDNFYGYDMYAKSGTAENGTDTPDAWFVGFTGDDNAPYAFVVWVKDGGYGSEVAAPIAARVINAIGPVYSEEEY